MILYLSHTKDGRWEILEPQEANMLLTRRIEAKRRVRAGRQVYEIEVTPGTGKRRYYGEVTKLIADPGQSDSSDPDVTDVT
jgi:hypothetical protein